MIVWMMTSAIAKCSNCNQEWEINPTSKQVPYICIICNSIGTVTVYIEELKPLTRRHWDLLVGKPKRLSELELTRDELLGRPKGLTDEEWRRLYQGEYTNDTRTKDKE